MPSLLHQHGSEKLLFHRCWGISEERGFGRRQPEQSCFSALALLQHSLYNLLHHLYLQSLRIRSQRPDRAKYGAWQQYSFFKKGTITSLGWKRKLIFEICYLSIIQPPVSLGNITLANEKSTLMIGVNMFITCLMLGRFYLFVRLASSISKYQNDRVVKIW